MEAAYKAWNGAFNRGDAKGLAAQYAENALLLPPTHNVTRGRQAIEQFFDELFKAGLTDHTLELIEAEGDQRGIAAAARWTAKKREGAGEQTLSGIATTYSNVGRAGWPFGYIRLTEQMCRRFRDADPVTTDRS